MRATAETAARHQKVLEILTAAGAPMATGAIKEATGIKMTKDKYFGQMLRRMRLEGLLIQATPNSSHRQATWAPAGSNGAAPDTEKLLTPGRQKPRTGKKVSLKEAIVRSARVRAAVLTTLTNSSGPMKIQELWDSIPTTHELSWHGFQQVLYRMIHGGQLISLSGRGEAHQGYMIAPAKNGAASKPRGPYKHKEVVMAMNKARELHLSTKDIGLEINQAEGTLAVVLGGQRVIVKVS
jgi:hypothetical protein